MCKCPWPEHLNYKARIYVGRVSLIICESDAKFKRTRCVEPSISRPRTIFVYLPQITENGYVTLCTEPRRHMYVVDLNNINLQAI